MNKLTIPRLIEIKSLSVVEFGQAFSYVELTNDYQRDPRS